MLLNCLGAAVEVWANAGQHGASSSAAKLSNNAVEIIFFILNPLNILNIFTCQVFVFISLNYCLYDVLKPYKKLLAIFIIIC